MNAELKPGDYVTLCARCQRIVMLTPEGAVIAAAYEAIGDYPLAVCWACVRALSRAEEG